MHDFPLLSLITFTPLVGAVVVGLLPDNRPDQVRRVAIGFALLAWVFSLGLVASFAFGTGGQPVPACPASDITHCVAMAPQFRFAEAASWIPNFGIQYKVGADGLTVLMVVLTTTLSWISMLASGPIKNRLKAYMISFLVLEVGMIGVFVALDLFLFYIFWEIVLVPMYLIIGIWGGANRIYATMKFVLYTLVGSLLMLVGILATAYNYQLAHAGNWAGAFDYGALMFFVGDHGGFSHELQAGAFLALFLAFAIKVPMWPFHTWLPDAHTEAPTAGSVILAGVMLKLGAYGLIRFAVPLYPWAAHTFAWPIIVMSVIAIVYGAIVSIVQPDLKRLVAYSSVSHMGFVTLGIFVFTQAGLQGAILQMVNHGLITGGLFLLVGVIYERTHDRSIAKMGGLAATMPIWSTVFGFFILASAGLPGLSGFIGEFLVFVGSFQLAPVIPVASIIVMVLVATYLLWMFQRMAFGDVSEFLRGLGDHITDMSRVEAVTLLPLGIGIVVFGFFPSLLLDFLRVPTAVFMAATGTPIGG